MKKSFLSLAIMLLVVLPVFSLDTNPYFGFKNQKTETAYQQYVGEKVRFRQAVTDEEKIYYHQKNGRAINQIGKEYTITKIRCDDYSNYFESNQVIYIFMLSPDKTEKIKIVAYSEKVYGSWSGSAKPTLENLPLYFVKPFEAFKEKQVGKTLTHPRVKDSYTVVDVGFGANTKSFRYTLRNDRTLQTKQFGQEFARDCFKEDLSGHYKSLLKAIEKPDNPKIRYGKTQIIENTSENDSITKYTYIDSVLSIIIFGDGKGFSFELKNISLNSIKVVWNDAAFIDVDGNTSKIMHKGTKYSQREGDQPATTIIKDAKISDVVYPIDNVYYDDLLGWGVKSMYHKIDWIVENQPDPQNYEGTVKLMLPIQIKNVVNEYIFVFDIKYVYDHPEVINLD